MFLWPSQACSARVSWPALARAYPQPCRSMCGWTGKVIAAHAPIRPNSAWKALGVIGPCRSVMKTCDDGPCSRWRRRRARVSPHLASDKHSATRFWPCGHAVDPSTARPETIGGRTARKSEDRGDSRSGSWLRPDGPSGRPVWRRPSAARLRARLDTHEFELGNLQLLVPTARPSVFPRYFTWAER
jgi:hypothetical protein